MSQTILHSESLSVGYTSQKQVIENASFSVNQGDIVLMLGENGSGKSTLIKTLAALQKPLKGDIQFKGKRIVDWSKPDLAKEMALVLTHKSVNGLMQVDEFIAFGRYPFTNWLSKLSEKDMAIIEKSKRICGLADFGIKRIAELSDGERQKVFLARAIAQQTNLLILDEPTTHLDIKNISTQLKLLKSLSEEGKTIIFSSHQFELALQIATKVWLIANQRLHEFAVEEFYENCEYQQLLLGDTYRYDTENKHFRIKI